MEKRIREVYGGLVKQLNKWRSLVGSIRIYLSKHKILILGSRDCGKCSIVRSFAGDVFKVEKDDSGPCTFRTSAMVESHGKSRLIDIEIAEFSKSDYSITEYKNVLAKGKTFIVVYVANDTNSIREAEQNLADIKTFTKKRDVCTVLVENKIDLRKSNGEKITNGSIEHLKVCDYHFRVSSKHREDIRHVFQTIFENYCTRMR